MQMIPLWKQKVERNKKASFLFFQFGGNKEPLGEGEKESEKASLKVNIQKTNIMASGPNTS